MATTTFSPRQRNKRLDYKFNIRKRNSTKDPDPSDISNANDNDTLPLSLSSLAQDESRSNTMKHLKRESRHWAKQIIIFAFGVIAYGFTFSIMLNNSGSGEDTSHEAIPTVALPNIGEGKPTTDRPIEQYDAVIVGAGWAGMAAAKALLEGGINKIFVLEANDYIGGRSKSINLDGSINNPAMHGNYSNIPVDMGSEWLYPDTSLSEYLIRGGYLNKADIKESYFVPLDDSPFYLQTCVDEKDAMTDSVTTTLKTERLGDETAKDLYDRVWGEFIESYVEDYATDDNLSGSFGDAAKKYKEEKLTNDLDAQFIDLAMAASEVDFTGDRNELSIWGDNIDGDSSPMYYMSIPAVGYGNTAAKFAAPFADKIQLKSKVTEIDYSNPSNAIISFTKNGVESKVASKTVLSTVSLGVLKAGNIKFTPSLPDWKQEVIDGMGFGLLNKCVLQWNDPNAAVWPKEEWFELITPRNKEENRDDGKWTTFFNPTSYKGRPTLVAWAAAENARHMESQTDDEVVDDVMTRLKAMFPTISPPDRHIITRWGSEENIHGTYSFKIVGRDFSDDSEQLYKPIKNVWFAGEASGNFGYGTVNGAKRSGEAAAEEMLSVISSSSSRFFTSISKLFSFF